MKQHEAASKALGGGAKKAKGNVTRMEIRKADSGGYIAKHTEHSHGSKKDHESEMMGHSAEHVLPDMAALQQHIQQNMPEGQPPPDPSQGQGEAQDQAAPASPAGM